MFQHPTGNSPRKVAIVAAGPSKRDWVDLNTAETLVGAPVDEVWGVNAVGRAIRCDVSFVMDDLRVLKAHCPNVFAHVERAGHPVITSTPMPGLDHVVPFPLGDVLMLPGGRNFFNHTTAYMVAYAALIGVEELLIFGADYIARDRAYDPGHPDHAAFTARYMACAAYWIGFATGRGMNVIVTPKSPLLDADQPLDQTLYGYLVKPRIRFAAAEKPVVRVAAKGAA